VHKHRMQFYSNLNVKFQNENIQLNPENYSECFTATQRKSLDPDFILVVNSENSGNGEFGKESIYLS
jgi:hypothetical protein